MFSGIVQGCGTVYSLNIIHNILVYVVKIPKVLLRNLIIGASIANNGCCLTVTHIKGEYVTFHIIEETLENTNLKYLKIGDKVNIERSLSIGDEIGGHLVSGHVSGVARVNNVIKTKKSIEVWIDCSNTIFMEYVFYKGFICINGISLTINKISNHLFCINLIPETIVRTNFKKISLNQLVNIEIDCISYIVVEIVKKLKG